MKTRIYYAAPAVKGLKLRKKCYHVSAETSLHKTKYYVNLIKDLNIFNIGLYI